MSEIKNKDSARFLFSFITVVILSFGFVLTFYSSIVFNPNEHFLKGKGDGIKNYFTFSYYIKYNESKSNFEGFNYPYGESVLYTDGHPLVSFILKKAATYFPWVSDHSVGLLNIFLLFSLILTSVFLFLIFYELRIHYLLSILSSVAIMILAPQIFRFGGHYALSYSCFIPIYLYLLMKFEKGKSIIFFSAFLILFITICLFTHAYLGMILIAFTAVYLGFKAIYEWKDWKRNYQYYSGLIASIIIPIGIFLSTLKLIDSHIGRTTNAGNLFGHSASFFSIFFPYFPHPLYRKLQALFNYSDVHWEDIAYIGMAANGVILVFVVYLIRASIKTKKVQWRHPFFNNKFLRIGLASSVVLLLFAMDLPFSLGMEGLLEIPPFEIIKNFRANGRFAWLFYFVLSISAVYFINNYYHYLISRKQKSFAILLIITYPLLLAFEGQFTHQYISKVVKKAPNFFNSKQINAKLLKALESIDKDKYQAIIPIPYYHTGSGNFRRSVKDKIFKTSITSSYYLGVPLMASRLSRVSIKESKNLVQLISTTFYKKLIADDITDDRPFLVIKSNEKTSPSENAFLERCKLVNKEKKFQFLEIGKDELLDSNANEEREKYSHIKSSLYFRNGFYVSDSTSYFKYLDFEGRPRTIRYRGEGSYFAEKNDYIVLTSIKASDLELGSNYIARIWMYNCGPNFGQDQLLGNLKWSVKGVKKWNGPSVGPRISQVIDGCWSLIELPITIKRDKGSYELIYLGKLDNPFYADDLLFYKEGMQIYRTEQEGDKTFLFKNNHKIPLD
jgi:hypothetical protein